MHDTQTNDKATTMNNWKTPGAMVLGHHNTPPFTRDLVPRSRMAPEKMEEEEVKQSCFFDKRVKPKNLARLNKFEKRTQRR